MYVSMHLFRDKSMLYACRLTLGLEITVDETHQMKVLQGGSDLCGVETRIVLWYTLAGACLQGSEELAAAAVLHAQIEVVLGLEGVIKSDDERVIAGRENLLLGEGSLDLVALDHLLLAQYCPGFVS